MSSDELPDVTARARQQQQPPRKSVAFRTPIESTEGPGYQNLNQNKQSTTDDAPPTPLGAALSVKAHHIATLHFGLRAFLDQLADKCLRAYATYSRGMAK